MVFRLDPMTELFENWFVVIVIIMINFVVIIVIVLCFGCLEVLFTFGNIGIHWNSRGDNITNISQNTENQAIGYPAIHLPGP